MKQMSYASVKPLVVAEEIRLASLYVTFRCPVTGAEITSTARIGEMTPVGGHPQRSSDDFGVVEVRESDPIGTFAGEANLPILGSPHFDMPHGENAIESPDALPPGIHRHAVVRAFESVRHRFRWDALGERFVAAGAA